MRRWDGGRERRILTDGELTGMEGTWGALGPGTGSGEAGEDDEDGEAQASLWEVGLAALWEAEAAGRGTETHHR